MITIPEKINKISKIILAVFLLLILGKTIQTYYSSLAQYGTGDQTQFSLPRFQKFLISPDSVNLNDCAHLSYIIVAIPGHMLEKHLNKTHKPQEKLFGDIQYTEIIAYSLFQVTFCLLLLFYCIYLIGALLKLNLRKDYLYYLIIAIVIFILMTKLSLESRKW